MATANILFEQQLVDDKTENEMETLGPFPRYRMGPVLEPTLEYYVDKGAQAAGPMLLGDNHPYCQYFSMATSSPLL